MVTVRLDAHSVSCEGHSGYAESGADIVCAAVTSAIRLVAALLDDTLGLSPAIEVDERRALIRISSAREEALPVFRAFAALMREYQAEYPEFVRVLESGRPTNRT